MYENYSENLCVPNAFCFNKIYSVVHKEYYINCQMREWVGCVAYMLLWKRGKVVVCHPLDLYVVGGEVINGNRNGILFPVGN